MAGPGAAIYWPQLQDCEQAACALQAQAVPHVQSLPQLQVTAFVPQSQEGVHSQLLSSLFMGGGPCWVSTTPT
jgi:hypothetical protein